jgi:tetratricopeptide (TPR) repeat protein
LLAWQAVFTRLLGETDQAEELLRKSLILLERSVLSERDTRPERAFSLLKLGELLLDADRVKAKGAYAQSADLYRELDDRWGLARALSGLSGIAENADNFLKAQDLAKESLRLARAEGDQAGMVDALFWLSIVASHLGQYERGEHFAREMNTVCQEMGGPMNVAWGYAILGAQLVNLGKSAEASRLLEESLALAQDLGWQRGVGWCTLMLGQLAMHQGFYGQARPLGEAALSVYSGLGNRWGTARSLLFLGQLAVAVGAHGEAQAHLQRSLILYQELGQRTELALSLVALAHAERGLDQTRGAWEYLREVLQIAREVRSHHLPVAALPALALFLADRGEIERAMALCSSASRFPPLTHSSWHEDVERSKIVAAAGALPPDIVTAAKERGQAGDVWATMEALLAELEAALEAEPEGPLDSETEPGQ